MKNIALILASQSPSRRDILKKLQIDHRAFSPDILEEKGDLESPQDYVKRLSQEKAEKIQKTLPLTLIDSYDDLWIIGSDQTGVCEGKIYEKPEKKSIALSFFQDFSGKIVTYYSGLTLLSAKTGCFQTGFHEDSVLFKTLSNDMIERYIDLDPGVLQCATGLKIETLGALLLESVTHTDPYAAQGLPILLLDKYCLKWGRSLFDFCKKTNGLKDIIGMTHREL
jgi:MAF protein